MKQPKNKNNNLRSNLSNGLFRRANSQQGAKNRGFRISTYPYRTRPSTFGPGTYKLSVTKLVTGSLENEVVLDMYADVLYQNPEFERIRGDFKYFKLLGITVIFQSRNLPTTENQNPAYMLLNYDGKTTINMRLQDNVKIIPAFINTQKIFKFKIPKINTYAGSMNNWLVENDLAVAGELWLQIHAPNNTSNWNFRVDLTLIARGPTSSSNSKTETTTEELRNKFKFDKNKEKEGYNNNYLKEEENELSKIEEINEDSELEKEIDKESIKNYNKEKINEIIREDNKLIEEGDDINSLYSDDDWFYY